MHLNDIFGFKQNLLHSQGNSGKKWAPKSSKLLIYVHGGGFVASSSQTHEIFCRPWCRELKIPLISIDYSLAPEHVYPRASEECFYVYAWCLLNKDALGWTGEKIICAGDSAGGLLVNKNILADIASF